MRIKEEEEEEKCQEEKWFKWKLGKNDLIYV